jgi:hypothetical protein
VAAHGFDRVAPAGQQADVDATLVVPVHEHHVTVRPRLDAVLLESERQHVAVEAVEGGAVVRLDHREHVRAHVGDHARGVARGHLVHRLLLQLEPTDPRTAPARDHLDGAIPGSPQQVSAATPQEGPLAVVAAQQPERLQVLEDPLFLRGPVGLFLEDILERRICREYLLALALVPPEGVDGLRSAEQVLHVEGAEAHHGTA